jgi:tRNA pseudouridine32 synthase/23S rRNA pseudouridine746 synthase
VRQQIPQPLDEREEAGKQVGTARLRHAVAPERSEGTSIADRGSGAGCYDAPVTTDATDLDIVHRGDAFVVVDKPSGVHSVPGRGPDKQDSISTRVRAAFPEADGPISVHRLDLDTSGLMVLALTRDAHRALSRQFMNRKPGKSYAAILDGVVEPERGAIDLPLIVDWPNRPRQMVCYERGRAARTLYTVTGRDGDRTRVEFRPITGRSHQLRVHAATPRDAGGLGAPIAGDSLYGDADSAPRLLLHAERLAFWDPTTHEWVKFESPPPF